MPVDVRATEQAVRDLMAAVGITDTPHTIDTPARVARWWQEFMDHDPGNLGTTFPMDQTDQMVVVSGIDVWSMCAHHLLPFSASVTVGYLADEQVLGLSKFARIVGQAAHRPTTQEQLVEDAADAIEKHAGTPDVAVIASGVHLCMAMRGVKIPATMTTSVTRGRFRSLPETRAEWLTVTGRR